MNRSYWLCSCRAIVLTIICVTYHVGVPTSTLQADEADRESLRRAIDTHLDRLRNLAPATFEYYQTEASGLVRLEKVHLGRGQVVTWFRKVRDGQFTEEMWRQGEAFPPDARKLHIGVIISNPDYLAEVNMPVDQKPILNSLSPPMHDPLATVTYIGHLWFDWLVRGYSEVAADAEDVRAARQDDGTTRYDFRLHSRVRAGASKEVSLFFSNDGRIMRGKSVPSDAPERATEFRAVYPADSSTVLPTEVGWSFVDGREGGRVYKVDNLARHESLPPEIFRLPYYGIDEPVTKRRWPWIPILLVVAGIAIYGLVTLRHRKRKSLR